MYVHKAQLDRQPETAFFSEVTIHITVVEKSYQALHKLHLYEAGDKRLENTASPIEAMTDLALFVNACALISKILGLCHNNARGHRLRVAKSIDMSRIKVLHRVDIRNSMEHMDERIDQLIASGVQAIRLWDMTTGISSNEITLRKFDPLAFTISCADKNLKMTTVSLFECFEDIQYLKGQIYR